MVAQSEALPIHDKECGGHGHTPTNAFTTKQRRQNREMHLLSWRFGTQRQHHASSSVGSTLRAILPCICHDCRIFNNRRSRTSERSQLEQS